MGLESGFFAVGRVWPLGGLMIQSPFPLTLVLVPTLPGKESQLGCETLLRAAPLIINQKQWLGKPQHWNETND